MSDELLYEVRDGIARVTFNRPQARNALTFDMYEGLATACGKANADRSIKARAHHRRRREGVRRRHRHLAIPRLQDAGRRADLRGAHRPRRRTRSSNAASPSSPPSPAPAPAAAPASPRHAICASPTPMRASASRSRARSAIASRWVIYRALAALIGIARAKEIIFTARLVEAPEALSLGLVSEVLPDHAALMARADALAQAGRRPRAADAAGDQGSAAPPAPQAAGVGGRGPHPHVLHEPGFPRRHGRLPQQAPAAMEGRVACIRGRVLASC